MGKEEGVVVHIQDQGHLLGQENAGEEIEMSQEGFPVIEARAGVVTGGVIQDVEQDLFVRVARQPGVGAGVVLPEGATVAGLPAFDGFGGGFETSVRGQTVLNGPASHTGPVGFEIQAAVKFAGGGAVGGRRLGGEQFGQQGQHLR